MPRRYVFTLNNYTADEIEQLMLAVEDNDLIRGLGFGYETGENGTPHLQGVVALTRNCRITQLKTWDGFGRMHLETMRDQWDTAEDYCKKGEQTKAEWDEFKREGPNYGLNAQYQFWGERPVNQGKRTDLQELQTALDSNVPLHEIAQEHFSAWMRYERGIRSYRMIQTTVTDAAPMVWTQDDFTWEAPPIIKSLILWGDAGIGKTEWAKTLLPNAIFVSHIDDLRNYDVNVHEGIIFDDMNFGHMPRTAQIHLLDYDNPRSIHVRYGTCRIPHGTKKIFTTNVAGGFIFDLNDSAIRRRAECMHLQDGIRSLEY